MKLNYMVFWSSLHLFQSSAKRIRSFFNQPPVRKFSWNGWFLINVENNIHCSHILSLLISWITILNFSHPGWICSMKAGNKTVFCLLSTVAYAFMQMTTLRLEIYFVEQSIQLPVCENDIKCMWTFYKKFSMFKVINLSTKWKV